MITERDVQILQFVNQFGFCQMPHISQRFQLNKPRNYQVVGKLVDQGLLRHEFLFHRQHGVYRTSNRGAKLTNLPSLKKIPTGIYDHEMTLIDLYFQITALHPTATWISERELVWDKFSQGVGKKGHVADGMLVFPEGKKVAVELELTRKGERRIGRILNYYAKQFDINEVWYFCEDTVVPTLAKLAANQPHIKIHLLAEYLHAKS